MSLLVLAPALAGGFLVPLLVPAPALAGAAFIAVIAILPFIAFITFLLFLDFMVIQKPGLQTNSVLTAAAVTTIES